MNQRDYEPCRARAPIVELQCEVRGPHEDHEVWYDGGAGHCVWRTCNQLDETTRRPCLRVLMHRGEHRG